VTNLLEQAKRLAHLLQQQKIRLTTAESCTGGQLAALITTIPGSSNWFERGFVTYSNVSKEEMLGVPHHIITNHGAVSKETVEAMAKGALEHSHAQLSVAITGIAGPEGGSAEQPVGTVWIAWQKLNHPPVAKCFHLAGERIAIRTQAVEAVLKLLLDVYTHHSN